MASQSQSSLLTLGGGVENLLLSYVSSGDVGLHTILNLRLVCSTTKSWVDDLPRHPAKKIFAKCQAKLDLYEVDQIDKRTHQNPFDSIRNFLTNPPPAHVSSLKLSGMKDFAAKQFSSKEDILWRRFAGFWWGRLESLELDTVDNLLRPKDSRVNILFSLSIQRLHCGELEGVADPLAFPQGLFSFEHLSIDKLNLPPTWTFKFFYHLARTPRLKSFSLSVSENVEDITNFLFLTKHKANLSLRFTVDHGDKLGPGSRREPKQLPPSFVSAIVASSASIRILKVDGKQLLELSEVVGEELAKKFFKSVECITEIELSDPADEFLIQFPNLVRLELLKNSASGPANGNKILFPPGLRKLGVQHGFPVNLPPTLTSLDILALRCSVTELITSLGALDKRCPRLESLHVGWEGDGGVCAYCSNSGADSNVNESQSSTPFRNLKSLSFCVDAFPTAQPSQPNTRGVPTKVNGVSWVLLNGFKLPKLSLLHFDLELNRAIPGRYMCPPVLDCSFMINLIRGNIGGTLLRVNIDESFVTRDALPLKTALEVMAKQNSQKRWLTTKG